ncbi:hypothetical protein ACFOWM_10585 [Ferruginibacter yonginensis]|uniref:Uncharacterized protein n=1 Tax=Ferruginibacter yonginensis TaxID=1310416 RepID=A0ABV8QUG0_9BACT
MKRIFVLATAALLVTSAAFATGTDKGKGNKKKCAKGKSCCSKTTKACCKDKAAKTAKM